MSNSWISLALVLAQLLICSSLKMPSVSSNQSIDETVENIVERRIDLSDGEPISPDEIEESRNIAFDEPLIDSKRKDPIELANLFEGDINNKDGLSGKNGVVHERQKWPGAVIPYTISGGFDGRERTVIANAIDVYHQKTCIKFVPRNSAHTSYISIQTGNGCSSYIGRTGRPGQSVSLGRGCVYTGIVQHELMHAAGFWHEQSRHDRDNYVTIMWNNIQTGLEGNFQKRTNSNSQTFGQSYDYESVMHYGKTAFSRNRQPTIVPKRSGVRIGQRNGLSNVDIKKLNALYNCGATVTKSPMTTKPPTTTTGDCVDKKPSCVGWSKRSECDRNPIWMKKNCAKSCGVCKPNKKEKCADDKTRCPDWAKQGFCTHKDFAAYMSTKCKKSCKICGDCN